MTTSRIDVQTILEAFDGKARLFPLPHLVLFPDAIAPLRVFEPRYIKMVEEALEDDGLIATALIRPGGLELDPQNPAIHPVVCLGRILRPQKLINGQYTLLLYGLARAVIEEEIPHEPFRKARVRVLEEQLAPEDRVSVAQQLRRSLALVPGRKHMVVQIRNFANVLRGPDGGPGRYADALADVTDLDSETRYEVLAETDVRERFDLLIRTLEARAYSNLPAPPSGTDPRRN